MRATCTWGNQRAHWAKEGEIALWFPSGHVSTIPAVGPVLQCSAGYYGQQWGFSVGSRGPATPFDASPATPGPQLFLVNFT